MGKRFDARLHAASAQIGFRFNSFIALALANKVAGPQGLLLISVVIGVCVPLLNVGAVWPMARHANKGFARELIRNPLIIGTVSGLVANLLGLQIPPWLDPTVTRIGQASLALGLMAAGAGMQFSSLKDAKTLGVLVLAVRHLAMPVMALGLALLFQLDTTQTTRPAAVLRRSHRVQLLRAGGPHGLQRRLRGRAGHAVDPARHGQPAFCTGRAGAAQVVAGASHQAQQLQGRRIRKYRPDPRQQKFFDSIVRFSATDRLILR